MLIISVICSLLLFILFPVDKISLEKSLPELHKRTCLFSLFIYAQLLATVTALQFAFLVLYVFFSDTFFEKFLCYISLGPCFIIWLVNTTCALAVIQKRMDKYLPEQNMYKLFIQIISFFLGIICYPFLLTTFHKGIWFFYLNLSGLVVQLLISYNEKKAPYPTYSYIYGLLIAYLAIQSNLYPIANFHELSYFELGSLFAFVSGLLVTGAYFMRYTKNAELIDDMF